MRLPLSLRVLSLSLSLAATATAQGSGPGTGTVPSVPDIYVPIIGVTGGIAIPIGRIADDHAAGYAFGGLVEYAVPLQPYALRGELLFQHFALKAGRSGTPGLNDVNLTSLGATIVHKLQQAPANTANTFVAGGIAIYHGTDLGTRPGVNAGTGIEIPLNGFSATGEARLHLMLSDGRPTITLPLTVAIRF